MSTRSVEAFLDGPAVRSNGERVRITLKMSWWFAHGVGLPVRWSVEEREDDRLLRRNLVDVTALDVLSQNAARAAAPN